MIFSEFIEQIEIDPSDIEKAKHYCHLKGVDLHFSIYEYLLSMKAGRIKYSEIATTYRYDKRIRKVLYKYVGLLEEYIRAYISNKYIDDTELIEWTVPIKKRLDKGFKLNVALDDILFGQLVSQVIALDTEDKLSMFPNAEYNDLNLRAIVELRNAVSHNRFLLNYLKFKECSIEGDKRSSLHANLVNFSYHLSRDIGEQFLKELDDCKDNDEIGQTSNAKNQTFWDLIEDIKIVIVEDKSSLRSRVDKV